MTTHISRLAIASIASLTLVAGCGDDDRAGSRRDSGPARVDSGGGDTDSGPGGDDGGTDRDTGSGDLCTGVDCTAMDGPCVVGVCDPMDGTCSAENRADGTACDDGDGCTTGDSCSAGTCGGSAVDCGGLTDACNTGSCDSGTGACVATPVADGTACDDGAVCTSGDACSAGTCGGTAVDCSTLTDMCNTGTCDPDSGACVASPVADGTSCSDGAACTTGDVCSAGTCGGTAVDCSGMADMCNMGVCDPASGACTRMPVADGTACSDGAACTAMDRCTAGTCGGGAVDCSGMSDMCNVGTCDPASGACTRMPVADGTACSDGSACTTMDRCTAGTCGGSAVDCSGMSDMCNVGTCTPGTGACGRTPRPDGTACTDADACTTMDRCTGGTCGGTRPAIPGDTCASPIVLPATDGMHTVTGSVSACTGSDTGGSCGFGGRGPELVYSLTLTQTRNVRLETVAPAMASYDTVLYIRRTCADTMTEVACNDDTTGTFSLINTTLTAGTYFVFVDAYAAPPVTGNFRLNLQISAPETCTSIGTIALPARGSTVTVTGSTTGAANDFTSTCGLSAASGDHVYQFTVAARTRLRIETRAPTSGIFDTVLHVRGSPCATGAGTTIVCDDDSGSGTLSRIDRVFDPGTYVLVVDGYNTTGTGNYVLEIENLRGHATLLGHDFFEREANADRALGNAVFISNNHPPDQPLRIVEYRQYADTGVGAEVELTRAAIAARATALGRTTTYTTLTDYTLLDLTNFDVLLVPEQELGAATMPAVATAWNTRLNNFIRDGGVIVVLDYTGGAYRVLNGAGLMTVAATRGVTGSAVTVTTASDPIAAGVASPYTALNGSNAYPGATGGTVVISQAADPVVLHLSR